MILIILAVGGIAGFQKGLITGLARFIGKIAAIVIAIFFHMHFLTAVEPVFGLREKIAPTISDFLTKILASKATGGGQFGNTDALTQPVITEATVVLTDYLLKIGSLIILFLVTGFIINLIIAVVITPLAKSLSIVNRGGGLAFGALSTMVGLCLVIGLFTPFLTASDSGIFGINDSLLYPWIAQGYDLLVGITSAFAEDTLTNPLERFPLFEQTPV